MIDLDREHEASRLRGSLLAFTQFFYEHVTGRKFIVSNPVGRESHHITVCRELTRVSRLEVLREIINIPPGSGKSTMVSMWIAWCWTMWPDSNFLYISYSQELAAKHTAFIKSIVGSRLYGYLFDVYLSSDSRAKDSFKTLQGGSIMAFGSGGAITGQDGGLPGLDRFSGAVIIDDAHKPDEAHSDTIRQKVIDNYVETIRQRPRGINVPIINIGQRLHEADLTDFLLSGLDVDVWDRTIIKGLDDAGNALYPEMMPTERLLALQEKSPYVFASQYQQDPLPAGGGLFKKDWFYLADEEPQMLLTFITADTAETNKNYNDPTVFSFWGLYDIEVRGQKTGQQALHWIDCIEIWVEPKELESQFMSFYYDCMLHPVKPTVAAIEKKSTGVTLLSALENTRGLDLREVKRTSASGSKTTRFLEIQPLIAAKMVSLPKNGKHTEMCTEHMKKITANDTHRHDDICFIAGTKIATKYGYKNIEDINKSDLVITPFGYGKITACGFTGYHAVASNCGLTGTHNHPVFHCNEFKHLDTICDDGSLSKLSFNELLRWNYKKLLISMELNTSLWDRGAIILANQKMEKEKVLKDFMWRFGNFITGYQYQKTMLFTTKTITALITTLKIWSVFQGSNTLKTMRQIVLDGIIAKKGKSILKRFKSLLNNGIKAIKVSNGIEKMPITQFLKQGNLNVSPAFANLTVIHAGQNFVQKHVSMSNMRNEHEKGELLKKVFNLTVEHYGVYYANKILVSNCDTAYDAIKIALLDKSLKPNTGQNINIAAKIMNNHKAISRARDITYGNS